MTQLVCLVDVLDARIDIRHMEDEGEKYRPAVTSPFNLTVSEKKSYIIIHAGENYGDYLKLLHYPTKSLAGCLTLADVQNNGSTFRGETVDLLVVVKCVKPPRKIHLKKDGVEKEISDLIIMDCTCSEMTVTLWEEELILR